MRAILLILKAILFPLMLIFNLSIRLRNWLYDTGIFKSVSSKVFTINIGNLTVGGTGKTPHVEYLIRLLSSDYKVSVLSRGYGRKTKGFVLADANSSPKEIGDEPFQIYAKFHQKINLAVCEKRVKGVDLLQEKFPENQIVVLDDAFQHRAIKPSLNILLCDFNRPFYADSLIPNGRLRDVKSSAKRADCVIITKIPEKISTEKRNELNEGIKEFTAPETPFFFSKIVYKEIQCFDKNSIRTPAKDLVLVEGIVNIKPMIDFLKSKNFRILKNYRYPDHFNFSRKIIDKIIFENPDNQFITTEKDMVKIKPLLTKDELKRFFYLPIEVEIEEKQEFKDLVLRRFKEFEATKS